MAGQCCGRASCKLLDDHETLRAQSRRGDCYANAQAKSPWPRLKIAEIDGREWPVFADLADARIQRIHYAGPAAGRQLYQHGGGFGFPAYAWRIESA